MVRKGSTTGLFPYVFDSSALFNLKKDKKAWKFLKSQADLGQVLIPEQVGNEVRKGWQSDAARRFLSSNPKTERALTLQEERMYFQVMRQKGFLLGKGESACIAVAMVNSHPIVMDEKPGTRKARQHALECHTSQEWLIATGYTSKKS